MSQNASNDVGPGDPKKARGPAASPGSLSEMQMLAPPPRSVWSEFAFLLAPQWLACTFESKKLCHGTFLGSTCWARLLQSCPILHNPMDCSPPGSSVREDSPGKNTGVDCHALLQGIFPTQGLNWGLPHCRQILYCLSHHCDMMEYIWSLSTVSETGVKKI